MTTTHRQTDRQTHFHSCRGLSFGDGLIRFSKFTLIYALFILESVGHILQEYAPHLSTVSPRLPATSYRDTASTGLNHGLRRAGIGQLWSAWKLETSRFKQALVCIQYWHKPARGVAGPYKFSHMLAMLWGWVDKGHSMSAICQTMGHIVFWWGGKLKKLDCTFPKADRER